MAHMAYVLGVIAMTMISITYSSDGAAIAAMVFLIVSVTTD